MIQLHYMAMAKARDTCRWNWSPWCSYTALLVWGLKCSCPDIGLLIVFLALISASTLGTLSYNLFCKDLALLGNNSSFMGKLIQWVLWKSITWSQLVFALHTNILTIVLSQRRQTSMVDTRQLVGGPCRTPCIGPGESPGPVQSYSSPTCWSIKGTLVQTCWTLTVHNTTWSTCDQQNAWNGKLPLVSMSSVITWLYTSVTAVDNKVSSYD